LAGQPHLVWTHDFNWIITSVLVLASAPGSMGIA
jgi:hypothetical protein